MTKSVERVRFGLGGALVLSVLAGGLTGCATGDDAAAASAPAPLRPQAFETPEPWFSGDRPVSQPLLLAAGSQRTQPRLVGRQRFEARAALPDTETRAIEGAGEVMRVTLATNAAPAEEVIRTIVGGMLERSYAIDPAIVNANAAVTLDIDEEMTRAGVMRLLAGLAEVYGWVIEDRGDLYFFRAAGTGNQASGTMAQSSATPILRAQAAMGGQTPVVRVRTMRSMSAANASEAVKDLLSPAGSVITSGQNLLIVDTIDQTRRAEAVLAALDVPAFNGVEIHTYRLAHRASGEAAQMLEEIGEATGVAGGDSPAAAFIAVPGTTDVMVVARDPSVLPAVRDLVELVDRPSGDTRRGNYLYRIQHYDPAQLLRVVREFMGDRIEGPAGASDQQRNQARSGSGPQIRIVLDQNEELLLIRATPEDYAEVVGLISSIDRPRQQVLMNVVVAEVSLTGRLEYGVEYFLNVISDDDTIFDIAGTPAGLNVPGTALLTLTNSNFQVVLDAVESESDVNVLSQPRVVARDGATVEFQVGGEVPIIQGDLNSDSGDSDSTQIRRDIIYRETGIILTVSPNVNESGIVTMEINQEINEVGATSELGPEFTTRLLATEVSVPHGETLLLAGLIEEETELMRSKIPLLGDIPVVGAAFQSQSNVETRRELILAITPTIIGSPRQARGTMGEFFEAAEMLQAALHDSADSLQRGVLEASALQTPLGGSGEAPEPLETEPEDDSPMRELREQLRMQSFGPWSFGPYTHAASYADEPEDDDGETTQAGDER